MIEFRNRTDPPSEPGWYWAKWIDGFEDTGIFPVALEYEDDDGAKNECLAVYLAGIEKPIYTEWFEWFGPVMMVREG